MSVGGVNLTLELSVQNVETTLNIDGAGNVHRVWKKYPLKIFWRFLSNGLEFHYEIVQIYNASQA